MEIRRYRVADHHFAICGADLCQMIAKIPGFIPFESSDDVEDDFSFISNDLLPVDFKVQYSFDYENILGEFGTTEDGFFLRQTPEGEEPLYMWCKEGDNRVYFNGNPSLRLFRFALWIGYGLMTYDKGTIAVHSSCIVSNGKAVIFLGESGTGKSTHTRLWREQFGDRCYMINDDKPLIRFDGEAIRVYGTPWAGKYNLGRNTSAPLKAIIQLRRGSENHIEKVSKDKAFYSIMKQGYFPPGNAAKSQALSLQKKLIEQVPFYELTCNMEPDAAWTAWQGMNQSDNQ